MSLLTASKKKRYYYICTVKKYFVGFPPGLQIPCSLLFLLQKKEIHKLKKLSELIRAYAEILC